MQREYPQFLPRTRAEIDGRTADRGSLAPKDAQPPLERGGKTAGTSRATA